MSEMSKNSEPNWIEESKIYEKCPKCPHGLLNIRVRRSFFVKFFLGWRNIRRYKCNNCGFKAYIQVK